MRHDLLETRDLLSKLWEDEGAWRPWNNMLQDKYFLQAQNLSGLRKLFAGPFGNEFYLGKMVVRQVSLDMFAVPDAPPDFMRIADSSGYLDDFEGMAMDKMISVDLDYDAFVQSFLMYQFDVLGGGSVSL